MQGTDIAVLGSIVTWGISYVISFFLVCYIFSYGIVPKQLRKQVKASIIIIISIISVFILIYISGLFYKLGGMMEKGKGIAWGCYKEDFLIGTLFLWFISGVILSLFSVMGFIKPKVIKFERRKDILYAYLMHNMLSILILTLMYVSITLFTVSLSGSTSTCL